MSKRLSRMDKNTDTVTAHGYNQISGIDVRKFSSSVGQLTSASNSFNSKESIYSSSNYDGRSSSNQELVDPFISGTNTRRSRPSFLDSINTSRISSPPVPKVEPQNVESSNLDFHTTNAQASSASQDSINAFGSSNGHSLFRHDGNRNNFESTHSFYSTKQNEDFSALEQVLFSFFTVSINWWKVLHLGTLLKGVSSTNQFLHQLRIPIILIHNLEIHMFI